MQINIAKGNATVRIYANDDFGPFSARVWVNTRDGKDGDATSVSRNFKSLKGAQAWAAKELSK